jgi:hypothetical protein
MNIPYKRITAFVLLTVVVLLCSCEKENIESPEDLETYFEQVDNSVSHLQEKIQIPYLQIPEMEKPKITRNPFLYRNDADITGLSTNKTRD